MDACAAEDRKFKMCKLLLEEFQEGLWSREDYRGRSIPICYMSVKLCLTNLKIYLPEH